MPPLFFILLLSVCPDMDSALNWGWIGGSKASNNSNIFFGTLALSKVIFVDLAAKLVKMSRTNLVSTNLRKIQDVRALLKKPTITN